MASAGGSGDKRSSGFSIVQLGSPPRPPGDGRAEAIFSERALFLQAIAMAAPLDLSRSESASTAQKKI